MDILDQIGVWNAGPLVSVGGSKKVFEREIGGQKFQFRATAPHLRRRMAQKATGHLKHLITVFFAGAIGGMEGLLDDQNKPIMTEETMPGWVALAKEHAPQILDSIADDELNDFIDMLVGQALFAVDGKFHELSNEEVAERAFDDDLTLYYPVALTVLEVNAGAGFFSKLLTAFGWDQSKTTKSENA